MNTIEEHELAIAIILSMYDDIVEARWWARRLKAENARLEKKLRRMGSAYCSKHPNDYCDCGESE